MKVATIERPFPDDSGRTQKLFRFPNGRGASVVRMSGEAGKDGMWEFTCIRFSDGGNNVFKVVEDTFISYQSEQEIDDLLDEVALSSPEE